MGYEAKKTEHCGPKRGNGAYWGYRWDTKKESNRIRRENAKREIRDDLIFAGEEVASAMRAEPNKRRTATEQNRTEAGQNLDKGRTAAPRTALPESKPPGLGMVSFS